MFFIVKITFLDYQAKIFSLIKVFGDLNIEELCCDMYEAFCDIYFSSMNEVVST